MRVEAGLGEYMQVCVEIKSIDVWGVFVMVHMHNHLATWSNSDGSILASAYFTLNSEFPTEKPTRKKSSLCTYHTAEPLPSQH